MYQTERRNRSSIFSFFAVLLHLWSCCTAVTSNSEREWQFLIFIGDSQCKNCLLEIDNSLVNLENVPDESNYIFPFHGDLQILYGGTLFENFLVKWETLQKENIKLNATSH